MVPFSAVWLIFFAALSVHPSTQSNATIDLTVISPINVGSLARFICNVTGIEVHNFTWLHNGKVETQTTIPLTTISLDPDNSNVGRLVIHKIPLEKAGNYTCIANNTMNGIRTFLKTSFYLNLVAPPKIVAELQQYAVLGSDAVLKCNTTGEVDVWAWSRMGSVVAGDTFPRFDTTTTEGQLKIRMALLDDAGSYTCTASSGKGSDTKIITFTVLTVPKIHSPQGAVTAEAGEQTILQCNATGIDTPTISWRLGGVNVGSLNDSRLVLHGNGSLVITNTRISDGGTYSCLAKNRAGNETSTATLNVTGAPELLKPPRNTTVVIKESVELSCLFVANPNNNVAQYWEKIDIMASVRIGPSSVDRYQLADNGSLIINSATDDDNGRYRCNVSNSEGNTVADAYLIVISPPIVPDHFMLVGSPGDRSFTIEWSVPNHVIAGRPIISYQIMLSLNTVNNSTQYINVPSNQSTYVFTDLLPGNSYEVSVAAVNQAGRSSYTPFIRVNTTTRSPELTFFAINESETDKARLYFMWEIEHDGGHKITTFAIEYRVENALENEWTKLFTPGLDVTSGGYRPRSLPPTGRYNFRAVFANAEGDTTYPSAAAFSIPEALPGQPSQPMASEVTTDSVTLNFNLDFMGTGQVNHFIVTVSGDLEDTKNISAHNGTYLNSAMVTVSGLEADSTYRFQVAGVNDIGKGPFSSASTEITTEKEQNYIYIIAGAVGGFVIIVVILSATLFTCYMCNRRVTHKHQISTSEVIKKEEVQVIKSSTNEDVADFVQRYEKRPAIYHNSCSDSAILSPVERSRSLQNRTASFSQAGSTISYGSSMATRTASLLHTKSNGFVPVARSHMYSSATVISTGTGAPSIANSKHWSPSSDSVAVTQRERRSTSSTYNSDTLGSRITNLATDV